MKERNAYIENNKEFGQRLRFMRKKTYLTQNNMAHMLGVERSTYAYYELGKTFPKLEIIVKLTEIFQCDINYLFAK